jgi:hypothetical protein
VKDKKHPEKSAPFSRKLYLLFMRFWYAISRKHWRKDIQVAALFPGENMSYREMFRKVDESLNHISQYDPRRYRQICRDVKRIWIIDVPPYRGQWQDELKICNLDRKYLCSTDVLPAEIASTIVHEATHARLSRYGIEYTPDLRMRIEHVCFRSEITFARRLPDGGELIKDAEARLGIPEDYWNNKEFQQRDLDTLAELAKKSFAARITYYTCKRLVKLRTKDEKEKSDKV